MEWVLRIVSYGIIAAITLLPIVVLESTLFAITVTPFSFVGALIIGEHFYNYFCKKFKQ